GDSYLVLFIVVVLVVRFIVQRLLAYFFCLPRPRPRVILFPYTSLFRSSRRWRTSLVYDGERADGGTGVGGAGGGAQVLDQLETIDRKSTRLNSSHDQISYAVFCLKKKTIWKDRSRPNT